MAGRSLNRFARLRLESLEPRLALVALPAVVISELMAQNDAATLDEDGVASDWIELYNPGAAPVDLGDWYLTDNRNRPTKWRFPAETIDPGEYLVVWATGNDRRTPGQPLHTNFALSADGEYLGLVHDDLGGGLQVVHELSPEFPPLASDVSYGFDQPTAGDPIRLDQGRYFATPSPGAANGVGTAETPSGPVVISRESGTFVEPFVVTISARATAPVQTQIFYTTDGAVPTAASTLYTGPLTINTTSRLRAVAVEPGKAPSVPVTKNYVALDGTVSGFESNLPIIILDTFGVGGNNPVGLSDVDYTYAASVFIDTDTDGRARAVGHAQYAGRSGLRIRGQSSTSYPKRPFALETRNENDRDLAVAVLGFPAESDWILKNPYVEKTLLNEVLASQWGRESGQYGPRARFVEVFVNADGNGHINYEDDYAGVYVLLEKAKIGRNRVDVAELRSHHNSEPEVTGGYIWKFDHPDVNEVPWRSWKGYDLRLHDPDDNEVTAVQKQWLIDHINEFEMALYGPQYRDPVSGFRKYIDTDSWITEWLLVEFFKGVESFRTAMYFYKDRGGKIEMGPLWDVNAALGDGNLGMAAFAAGWRFDLLNDADLTYYRRLFSDADFRQRMIDRWAELRRTVFATDKVLADIDALVGLLSDGNPLHERILPGQPSNPLSRNYVEHPVLDVPIHWNCYYGPSNACPTNEQGQPLYPPPRVYDDHLVIQKNFVTGRLAWMDSQFITPPAFAQNGGAVSAGYLLTLSSPVEGASIYYTTDGSDPRGAGGAVSSTASHYVGPIALNSNQKIVARSNRPGIVGGSLSTAWSAPTDALFITHPTPLVITEINFNPAAPTAAEAAAGLTDNELFEFIELKNVGGEPLDLSGMRFTDGIDFTFPATTLPAGGHVLVVKNQNAFAFRYGPGLRNITGEYGGNLANEGERIALETALGDAPLDFTYDDWHDLADGEGFTLAIVNSSADRETWDLRESWRPSDYALGTPDGDDAGLAPAQDAIVINEIVSHSTMSGDRIEIANSSAVPIDIHGFFLSDDPLDPTKYRLPANTPSVPAGGFLVLDAESYFGAAFGLAPVGGTLVLHAADAVGNLIGFRTIEEFGASLPDTTHGRYVKSDGATDFVELMAGTLGEANAPPRVGPVAINELLYNPAAGKDEFIELVNITAASVSLDGWALASAVEYGFSGVTLAAGERLVVASIEPAALRVKYSIPAGVQIVGPYLGVLDDDDPNGESVELYQPSEGSAGVLIDRVRYFSTAPWPTLTNRPGLSLVRLQETGYGNDAINWGAGIAGGTPGGANLHFDPTPPSNPGAPVVTVLEGPRVALSWAISTDHESGVARYHVFRNHVEIGTSTTTTFIDTTAAVNTVYSYYVVARNPSDVASFARELAPLRIFSISSVTKTTPNQFRVTFPESLTADSAQNAANYHVTGATLTAAVLEADARSVLLSTATPIVEGHGYRVVANNLVGTATGSVLSPNANLTIIPGIFNALLGEYYDDLATNFPTPPATFPFGTKVGERIDSSINFTWLGAPQPATTSTPFVPTPTLPASAADTLGICWSGRLVAPATGTYTFSFTMRAGGPLDVV